MNYVVSMTMTFTCTDCGATSTALIPSKDERAKKARLLQQLGESVKALCSCPLERYRAPEYHRPEQYREDLAGHQLTDPRDSDA